MSENVHALKMAQGSDIGLPLVLIWEECEGAMLTSLQVCSYNQAKEPGPWFLSMILSFLKTLGL